jgi:hypothetical protein
LNISIICSQFYTEQETEELDECKIRSGKLGAPQDLDMIIPETTNIALSDFDMLGTLVKNELINEQEVPEIYWNTII